MLAYEEMISGEPQRQEEVTFYGFALPDEENYFSVLHDWKMIGAHINNLAEYKIVDYILQVTWGTGNPYNRVPLTIESLMNGYIDEEGVQIDNGTGLSKQSVVTGIEKAIKHGLIERDREYWTDEDGRTRSTRYYGLHFYVPVEVKNVDSEYFPDGSEVEIVDSETNQFVEVNDLDFEDNQPVEPFYPESQEFRPSTNSYYPSIDTTTDRKVIRIRSQSKKKETYPGFIKKYIEELSHNFGDKEHTGSNIAQATNLYERSGMSEREFTKVLDEARELSRGKPIKKMNSRKWPNRMPFFFGCLRNLLKTGRQKESKQP